MKRLAPFLALALLLGGCSYLGNLADAAQNKSFDWTVVGRWAVQVALCVAAPKELETDLAEARVAAEAEVVHAVGVPRSGELLKLRDRWDRTVTVLCPEDALEICRGLLPADRLNLEVVPFVGLAEVSEVAATRAAPKKHLVTHQVIGKLEVAR